MSEPTPSPDNGETEDSSPLSLVHRTDLVIALVILAGCLELYGVTTTFEEVSELLAQNIPPEFFPRLVIYAIALLALLLPFEHIVHKRRGKNIDSGRSERIRRMPYLTGGLLVLVIFAMPYLGVLVTLAAICVLLPLLWGERRWKLIAGFAILFPLAVGLVFNKLLQVYFDGGIFNLSM